MSFRRTASGLSNLYLFFRVDAVVYLEGGRSLCRDDVDNGIYTDATHDIRFWQTVFGIYRPGKLFKFCSIGSKETVNSIAQDIVDGAIANVIVAMDRDFDHINDKLLISDNVIYTHGYSWENDAWNETSLREAFCALSGACKTKIQIESDIIGKYYKECAFYLKGSIRMDAVLSQHGYSFFDRDSYMRYVKIECNGQPMVHREHIKNSMFNVRQKIGKPIVRKAPFLTSPLVDCFGHLFAEYAYRILVFLLEKIRNNPKIPKDYATSMIVEKFGQLLANGLLPDLNQHYDSEFSHVMP